MSIYRADGSELLTCYDKNGTVLAKAFDADGAVIYTATPPKYSIENVVNYYKTPVLSAANDINNLSSDWHTFIHITDMHGNGNKNHSQAIALYLLDNTSASFIVLGGDYFGYGFTESEYASYMNPLLNSGLTGDVYAILGNHDVGVGGSSTWKTYAPETIKQRIYNDFLKDKSNLIGSPQDTYYYFDDADAKVRYLFANTSDTAAIAVGETQLSWIDQSVILPDSSWSLLVIGHVPISSTDLGFWTGTVAQLKTHLSACNGNVIGYLCGHEHIDYIYDNGSFTEATMICDKFENVNYYPDYSVTDRVSGTESEQAVSVISFNTSTREVVIRRIGAGRNKVLSYTY